MLKVICVTIVLCVIKYLTNSDFDNFWFENISQVHYCTLSSRTRTRACAHTHTLALNIRMLNVVYLQLNVFIFHHYYSKVAPQKR